MARNLICQRRSPAAPLRRWAMAVALVWAVSAAPAAEEPEQPYLNEDAVLTGKIMHSFSEDGELISVILGDFSLTIGQRTLTARDAVLWVVEKSVGGDVLRDIRVYLKGDADRPAKVVEPDGTTTKDRALLVVLRQRGELRAKVDQHTERDVRALPLYAEAAAMRKGVSGATQPGRPGVPAAATREAGEATTLPARRAPEPVRFRADETTSRLLDDPREPGRKIRAWIAKGNVYLSQGIRDSDLFLEITAQAAVIYTDAQTEPRVELAQVLSAYLEGDVVLRRGERTVQGDRLFYDFRTGRAIILQPVLRTVQKQRDIPVYIRAREARQLAARPEGDIYTRGNVWVFRDALVTTSDFYTPEYHIGARRVYLEDTTPYDEKGKALAERSWESRLVNTTFNVRGIPLLWWPYTVGDAEEGHTALRKVQVGRHGRFGWGVESDWFLFRLLGLRRPEGFDGRFEADWYERGVMLGSKVDYQREKYVGHALLYGLLDRQQEDEFGTDRRNIDAPAERGRFLWRHKHFLPRDWQLQVEASYLCDKNFLEEFFPGEYWTGKEQENLIYAIKQQDNWAVTVLAKWRINDFLTQTESLPDVAGYVIGQSLARDILTYYGEGHLGFVRYRPEDDSCEPSSETVARADTRQELDLPLALGPVKLLPYVAGRVTYWEDTPEDQGLVRPWGQVGVNAAMHVWRIYDQATSRVWDINRLKHVITPYGALFWSCTDVEPDRLNPFSPDVEQYVQRLGGGQVGVRQLWQTKRGPAGDEHTVDWLRADVYGAFFDDADTHLPADGRYYFYRPEYSLPRNALNGDVAWNISDSTTFLADANVDTDDWRFGRGNVGVAIVRDPRLRYYVGIRCIDDLDSSVGTFGVNYQINRKYTLSVFEQYDFDFAGGQNTGTSVTLVRKFPRLYVAFTFVYDRTQDDVGFMLSIWPEGIPEARIGGGRFSLLQAMGETD